MSTRIEIGDRVLWADNAQWVVGKRAKRKTKDGGYEEYDHGLWYYGRLDSALKGLLDERLRKSGATDIPQLRAELDAFRKDVAELLVSV